MTMPFEPKRNTTIMKPSTMLAALLASALVASGCGGSSSPKKPAVQTAHPTAAPSNPDIGQAQAQVTEGAASAAPSTLKTSVTNPSTVQMARAQPGAVND